MAEPPREVTTSMRPATIELWHAGASVHAPGPLEDFCERSLTPDEIARANRFVQATSRNQHVVGRGMARWLLAGDRPPTEIRFRYLNHGKPIVEAPAALRRPFNIAHTSGLVVCGLAIDPGHWLGVDVERLDRRTDPGLAERYFSPPEVGLLRDTPAASRQECFLRIWTLKEAFIKALGTGLQTPLEDFAFADIDADRPTVRCLRPGIDGRRRWQFWSLEPRPGFIAAVAIGVPASPDDGPPDDGSPGDGGRTATGRETGAPSHSVSSPRAASFSLQCQPFEHRVTGSHPPACP